MGFQTPLYELSDYLEWTNSGRIQLPDFQRGYKWEDERIRSLLVTVLRGHPLGVVMLLKTGNDQVRFKPKPLEGTGVSAGTSPELLLLDGQQRLTSLTQALSGDGVVATMDGRGKLLKRRYYVDIAMALDGEDRIDEAVRSIPGDGIVRSNFGKDIELDVSTEDKERKEGFFPVRLLFSNETVTWLFAMDDKDQASTFHTKVIKPATTYNIPAIELDTATSKSAVATVFEKVNTGGLSLNVFELLTATFAGDKKHFDAHGTDFRLNDDWVKTQKLFAGQSTLAGLESTDFLQAVTLLATRTRAQPRRHEPQASDLRAPRGHPQADARRVPRLGRSATRRFSVGRGLPRRSTHLHRQVPPLSQAAGAARCHQGHHGCRRGSARTQGTHHSLVLVWLPRRALRRRHRDPLRPRHRTGARLGLRSPGCRVTPNGAGCELRRVAPAFAAHSQCRSLQRHLRAPAHQ